MQDTELVFDEEYINGMAEYFEKQGKQLQKMSDDYVKAMRRIGLCQVLVGIFPVFLYGYLDCCKI